ncbi:MAG: hypothetical protein ACRDZ4_11965 [Egibacteraceae bacterium]
MRTLGVLAGPLRDTRVSVEALGGKPTVDMAERVTGPGRRQTRPALNAVLLLRLPVELVPDHRWGGSGCVPS